MTQEDALKTLSSSLFNLKERKGHLTLEQVETEVINLACLEILKNKQNPRTQDTTQKFSNAAKNIFPRYTDAHATIAFLGVSQNVGWDGMWEFLKNYFMANHGFNIDGVDDSSESKIFYSTRHIRYEMNKEVANTPADRTIDLLFTDDRTIVLVNILPTLSAKKANIIERVNNNLVYVGADPDYKFTIIFDEIDEISKFILEMPNRNLRIEYFE